MSPTIRAIFLLLSLIGAVSGQGRNGGVQCIPGRTQFPNPTDRHSFYKCDAGGNPILFQCPPGTWFNPRLEVCDWDTGNTGTQGGTNDQWQQGNNNNNNQGNRPNQGGNNNPNQGGNNNPNQGGNNNPNQGGNNNPNQGGNNNPNQGGNNNPNQGGNNNPNQGGNNNPNQGGNNNPNQGGNNNPNQGSNRPVVSTPRPTNWWPDRPQGNEGGQGQDQGPRDPWADDGGTENEGNNQGPEGGESCRPSDPFQPNPRDCSTFFACRAGRMVLSACAQGTYFQPRTARCAPGVPSGCTLVRSSRPSGRRDV